jgi:imidazole glycerol-phosphate synthase subunit HisF
MFRPRIIPCLLLKDRGLVKTVRFKKPFYIGDPINTVKIFNEKEVDEIIILDIMATTRHLAPDFEHIKTIVDEAFMPVCYGGGIKHLREMERLFSIGIEKVSLSSSAILDPKLITEAVRNFGSQAIVAILDVKKRFLRKKKVAWICNGKKVIDLPITDLIKKLEDLGVGELAINDIDRDGTMMGYDISFLKSISGLVKIPVIALGGAGKTDDLKKVIQDGGCSAAAAGSLFVYYGRKKGVLITYPQREVLDNMLHGGQNG